MIKMKVFNNVLSILVGNIGVEALYIVRKKGSIGINLIGTWH